MDKEDSSKWQGEHIFAGKESQDFRHVSAVIACDVARGTMEMNCLVFRCVRKSAKSDY